MSGPRQWLSDWLWRRRQASVVRAGLRLADGSAKAQRRRADFPATHLLHLAQAAERAVSSVRDAPRANTAAPAVSALRAQLEQFPWQARSVAVVDRLVRELTDTAQAPGYRAAFDLYRRLRRSAAGPPADTDLALPSARSLAIALAKEKRTDTDAVLAYLEQLATARQRTKKTELLEQALRHACHVDSSQAEVKNRAVLATRNEAWAAQTLGRLALRRSDFAAAAESFAQAKSFARAGAGVDGIDLDMAHALLGLGQWEQARAALATAPPAAPEKKEEKKELAAVLRAVELTCGLHAERRSTAAVAVEFESLRRTLTGQAKSDVGLTRKLASAAEVLSLERRLGGPASAWAMLRRLGDPDHALPALLAETIALLADLGPVEAAELAAAPPLVAARQWLALGRLSAAAQVAGARLEQPRTPAEHVLRADFLVRTGRAAEVAADLAQGTHDPALVRYAFEVRVRRDLALRERQMVEHPLARLDAPEGLLLAQPQRTLLCAAALEATGDHDGTLAALAAARAMAPLSSHTWSESAVSLACLGRDEDAAACVAHACRLEPHAAACRLLALAFPAALRGAASASRSDPRTELLALEPNPDPLVLALEQRLRAAGRSDLAERLRAALAIGDAPTTTVPVFA